jgi:hypothetical protein
MKWSVIACFLLAIPAFSQSTSTVTAANIEDINGSKLAAGSMCMVITDQNDNQVSVQVSGGGQTLKRAYCSPVVTGTVTSFTVPNPATTSPSGIYYRITVKDTNTGQEVLRYTHVTFSGGSFAFDNFTPTNLGPLSPLSGTSVVGNLSVAGNVSATGVMTAASFVTAAAGGDTVFGNFTSLSAVPLFNAVPSCTDTVGQHINYVLGSGFTCGTSSQGGTGTVTNIATSAPISGGPITTTGTVSCPTCTTNASALTSGQLVKGAGGQATQVGDLSGDVSTAGGTVTTLATVATPGTGLKTTVNAKGLVTGVAAAACADLSNAAASCSTNTTNASNITTGTLPAAQLPNPTATTLGGIESLAAVGSKWINTISTSGVPSATQPAFTDITGAITAGQLPATAVTSASSLTSNAVVLGAGSQGTKTATFLTTDGAATLTVGVAAGGNGVLALAGNTSGTATCTAPAVAGTTTNGVTCSNVWLGPNGAVGTPTYSFTNGTNSGIYARSNGSVSIAQSGALVASWEGNSLVFSGGSTSNGPAFGATNVNDADTFINRSAPGVLQFGAAVHTSTAKLKASAYMSVGTKFTTNNGCTDSATAGGATAGTFTVGSTSCTEIITMGDTATSPNGWSCTVVDITTLADVTNPHQTTSSTTTATIVTGTVVSGDKIQFSCIGY